MDLRDKDTKRPLDRLMTATSKSDGGKNPGDDDGKSAPAAEVAGTARSLYNVF